MSEMDYGTLVISLDFELMWGILDRGSPMDYKDNIAGVWKAVPQMLKLFEKHQIHVTWGVVGLIANSNIMECRKNIPRILPRYQNENLSAYAHFGEMKKIDSKYICAPMLVRRIADTKYQEIGSHTFSHYYCSEKGQSEKEFRHDLKKAREALGPYGGFRTLILPRNQLNEKYADAMKDGGVENYRGNEKMWIYAPCGSKKSRGLARRLLRLLDHYISISGHNCYGYSEIPDGNGLNNIRSSRFFRPYVGKLRVLEPLRMRRIKRQMKHAAVHHQVFHIWWHPHNFGTNRKENFRNLAEILKYFEFLKERYGMKSLNMGELGELLGRDSRAFNKKGKIWKD